MNKEKSQDINKSQEVEEPKDVKDTTGPEKGEEQTTPPIRQIIINTDGNNVSIAKADVSALELRSILQLLLENVNNNRK